ncbi:MAG: hypothetical protein IJ730_01080 [Alphaproteobacteria bacterium]|nr:hypothetical protein [Alphaproteobacteria bacterium]
MRTKKSTVFFIFLTCAICSWLFYLKYSVIDIENRIRYAKKQIIEEKKNLHILKAEWKSLTSPDRIQALAKRHLDMKQMDVSQLREFDASLFHSERRTYKRTKRLSQLVDEIMNDRNIDNENDSSMEEN